MAAFWALIPLIALWGVVYVCLVNAQKVTPAIVGKVVSFTWIACIMWLFTFSVFISVPLREYCAPDKIGFWIVMPVCIIGTIVFLVKALKKQSKEG